MTEKAELVNVGLDLIDPPVDQQRVDMDEEKLQELVESVRDHGLLNPITVRKKGERYELIAGWRRLQAHRRLGLALIEAKVISADDERSDVLRAVENEFRHDINPVESAIYLRRFQEKYNWDAARIAKELNRSVAYVEGRFELLAYPEYILEPLALGKLSLGAAQWLAKIPEDLRRRQYVIWGVQGGISVAQAHAWYQHAQLRAPLQGPAELPTGERGGEMKDTTLLAECLLCHRSEELSNLGMFYSHKECADAIRDLRPPPPVG